MAESANKNFLRVNFSLRGFAKVMNVANMSAFTPDAPAVEAFGRFLSSLTLQPGDPVLFSSLSEFRGLDYAGYIIEKERLDQSNGTWVRVEEYRIMGANANSYKDTRVAYGQTYRYRIRAVAKFTGYETAVISINNIQRSLSQILETSLTTTFAKNISLADRLFPAGLKSSSDANSAKTIKLADNVFVSVDASGIPKFNYNVDDAAMQSINSQALSSLRQLQAALASNQPMSGATVQTLVNGLKNYTQDAETARAYSSEYIVSHPSRNWKYVTVRAPIPPAFETFKIVPSTPNKQVSIYWLSPPDECQNMAALNIFRRNEVGDPWAMIAENVPITGSFTDIDVQVGKNYIYALQSKSLHGLVSFLSTQIQIKLNESFSFEKAEKPLKYISGPGVRPDEPDTILSKFFDPNERLVAYKNISVSPSKIYNDAQTTVILRIKSLDTQDDREVKINLTNQNI